MFRQSTRERRLFSDPASTPDVRGGGLTRAEPSVRIGGAACLVPVDVEDPDIARLDERRERVLFSVPDSQLLQKYNVDRD